jgi:hypothetical protein
MKGAHTAAIGDAAGFVDDVEALGPGGVGVISGVVDVINAESDGIVEAFDEIVGDGDALSERFRLGVADVVLHVGLHLPFVRGMRFADVDGQKIGVIFIVVINLYHVTDVAAKRWSSVTAEDDDEGARAGAFADVEAIGTVESNKSCVGSVVANFEIAPVHVGQGIAEHAVSVLGAAGHLAEKEKGHEQ